MTSFYLAACWDSRELMRGHRAELEAAGHHVTSRWIFSEETKPGSTGAKHAGITDLQDIDAASIVLLFTDVPSSTGGYHVELGYALGRYKLVIVIGPITNIFQRQARHHFSDWNTFRRGYVL